MRITAINWPANCANDGLLDIRMERLGKIVVLAGKNGSGKSRLLARFEGLDGSGIPGTRLVKRTDPTLLKYWDRGEWKVKYNGVTVGILALELDGEHTQFNAHWFCPSTLASKDPSTVNKKELIASISEVAKGFQEIGQRCWVYIQHVQDRWLEARFQDSTLAPDVKAEAEKSYDQLTKLIEQLVCEKPDRDRDGLLTLFGRPTAKTGMSHGQQSLLQFAVGLHAQAQALEDTIVLMDEPEKHLHAGALVDVVTRVATILTSSQLWIATHSVPLIAALTEKFADELSLFCMENGAVSYAGRTPERVLSSLMGGDENINAMRQFVSLPDTLARVRFAAQCLQPSGVVDTAEVGDPQIDLIRQALNRLRQEGVPLRVLDFGAGKGRVLSALTEDLGAALKQHIDYVALDCTDEHKTLCITAIERAYGASTNRWYSERDRLFSDYDAGTFDVVVMCNVLHEIDPVNWPNDFGENGLIAQALGKTGHLLIVEDHLMPQGEHSHRYGFVVLNAEQLKSLFAVTSNEGFLSANASGRFKGRIRCHLIPSATLSRVTPATRKAALDLVRAEAKDAIHRLRSAGAASYREALEHAFWIQQYANSSLACADL